MADIEIRTDDLTDPAMVALLERHAQGMLDASPPGTCHFFDLEALRAPLVTVWSAWIDGDLAGCGAIAELDPRHGEVKSMRTDDRHLGKGVGRAVLEHILEQSRARGYERLSLETGTGEAFAAATRLYESAGFSECGPFGTYEATEWNRYFTLEL